MRRGSQLEPSFTHERREGTGKSTFFSVVLEDFILGGVRAKKGFLGHNDAVRELGAGEERGIGRSKGVGVWEFLLDLFSVLDETFDREERSTASFLPGARYPLPIEVNTQPDGYPNGQKARYDDPNNYDRCDLGIVVISGVSTREERALRGHFGKRGMDIWVWVWVGEYGW